MLPLKEAISQKHKQAERMPFNVRMFRGQLTKNEYLLYLHQQLQVFKEIESIGLPHPSLKRSEKVQADIDELTAQGHSSEITLASTIAYTKYLGSLSYHQLLPHIYLNYMGILFGGQMIKNVVPSSGKMYAFENVHEAVQAIRAIQKDEWAAEVNKGFDFNIAIFVELEEQISQQHLAANLK